MCRRSVGVTGRPPELSTFEGTESRGRKAEASIEPEIEGDFEEQEGGREGAVPKTVPMNLSSAVRRSHV
jgi:hypothetical protein